MIKIGLITAVAVAIGCGVAASRPGNSVDVSELAPVETEAAIPSGLQTAVFAGGCFWGVEAVFEHVKGVTNAKSGYAGGDAKTANYDAVGRGNTGHAEAVQVTFDPSVVTYAQLLSVFFSVAHDPTEVDRQGPDVGPQYRSVIFYSDRSQQQAAEGFIKAINASKALSAPIATQVVPLVKFYDAEAYHQDYLRRNPTEPYIVIHDMPKLDALKQKFPALYKP